MSNWNREVPEGVDLFLYPFGGWKIVSFTSRGDEFTTNYRCVKCRQISTEKSRVCPTCGEHMKYQKEMIPVD